MKKQMQGTSKVPTPSKGTTTKVRWLSRDVLVAARVEAAKAEMGLSDWIVATVIDRIGGVS